MGFIKPTLFSRCRYVSHVWLGVSLRFWNPSSVTDPSVGSVHQMCLSECFLGTLHLCCATGSGMPGTESPGDFMSPILTAPGKLYQVARLLVTVSAARARAKHLMKVNCSKQT